MKKTSLIAAIVCAALCTAPEHLCAQAKNLVSATITINATKVAGHINPMLYGAFMEMMAEDVKYGLYAEMLHDRSFEGCTDNYGLPREWHLEPDERNDNVGAILFKQTSEYAYPRINTATGKPEQSLEVTLRQGDIMGSRRGLSQSHIDVRGGIDYIGYLWLKSPQGFKGSITVAFEEDITGGARYASAQITNIVKDWKQYRFRLHPTVSDKNAKFSILFNGQGVVWMDKASLMPADAVGGVRADVLAKVRELHPSFIRWPGGNVAQDYNWQWGIGPRDQRPVFTNIAWSNAPEPNDFGTDEYIAFCRAVGAEPSITVNVEGGAGASAEEAAHWVEYTNGPVTSKYGAMRAANGHPDPYHVKFWELGNEVFGGWVRGHADAETYSRNAKRYAEAMRAVDSSIRLIAVGENIGNDPDAWDSTVLRNLGNDVDYLAVHDYVSQSQAHNDRTKMMVATLEFEKLYGQKYALIEQVSPRHPVPFVVNEWNLFYPSSVIQSMDGGVYAARMMNAFERSSDQVAMSSISDLLNGWVGGVIQASRTGIYVTPQFYAIRMYNNHLATDRLAAEVISPDLDSKTPEQAVPALDAVASRSTDGRHIYINLTNADLHDVLHTSIKLRGVHVKSAASEELLSASTPESENTFANPDVIKPVSKEVTCAATCNVDLPADSVAVITLTTR